MVRRDAWSVERDERPVSSTKLPASMTSAVTPFRAPRSTLHALRISLLLRDLIRPIARHTELRDELGDHVASTPSFGN